MLFGELIKSLSSKAGIKEDDETLKKILSFSDASQFDVPEEFSNSLEQNLLTVESAKANKDVRLPLFSLALDGVDSEMDRIVNDLEFDDVFKGEYKSISKNTNEKARKISAGIKKLTANLKEELKTAKKNPKNDESAREIEVLTKEIEKLNREAENLKTLHKNEVENIQTAQLNERINYALRTALASRPLPKNGIPHEVNILTAETLIKNAMATNGLRMHIDEFGNPIIKQVKEGTETEYFVDNKKRSFSEFLDRTLADNKFVQINDQTQPQLNGNGNNPPASITPGVPTNSALADESRQLLESFMGQTV